MTNILQVAKELMKNQLNFLHDAQHMLLHTANFQKQWGIHH